MCSVETVLSTDGKYARDEHCSWGYHTAWVWIQNTLCSRRQELGHVKAYFVLWMLRVYKKLCIHGEKWKTEKYFQKIYYFFLKHLIKLIMVPLHLILLGFFIYSYEVRHYTLA